MNARFEIASIAFDSIEDLASFSGSQMVTIYNSLAGTKIKKFESKGAGLARTQHLVADYIQAQEDLRIQQEVIDRNEARRQAAELPDGEAPDSESIAAVSSEAPKHPQGFKSVRKLSKFDGHQLYPTTNENKRRPQSYGHRSLQIIIENPGIYYSEFIAQGGRLQDLVWDSKHGNVNAAKS